MVRQAQNVVVPVQQDEVNSPCIDTDALEVARMLMDASCQPCLDLRKEPDRIPVEAVQDPLGFIGEAMDLLELDDSVRYRTQQRSPTLSSKIEGQIPRATRHSSTTSVEPAYRSGVGCFRRFTLRLLQRNRSSG